MQLKKLDYIYLIFDRLATIIIINMQCYDLLP